MRSQGLPPVDLSLVASRHERLRRAAGRLDPEDAEAVLLLGAAVLLHAAVEPAHAAPVLELADEAVREQLAAEHARLEADLALLEEMLEGEDTVAEDVAALSRSLLTRLREHLARDERLLYGPLVRLGSRAR